MFYSHVLTISVQNNPIESAIFMCLPAKHTYRHPSIFVCSITPHIQPSCNRVMVRTQKKQIIRGAKDPFTNSTTSVLVEKYEYKTNIKYVPRKS